MPMRRQAPDKTHPCKRPASAAACARDTCASRRRAIAAQACRRGSDRRATPGGSAAPPECAQQIPRSIRIAAAREAPD